jgi:hypothetical protein
VTDPVAAGGEVVGEEPDQKQKDEKKYEPGLLGPPRGRPRWRALRRSGRDRLTNVNVWSRAEIDADAPEGS